jgi:hypothetical protein
MGNNLSKALSIFCTMQKGIIALDGKPLESITSIENVSFFMKQGKIYKKE